jgi:hypothetical protein
MLFDVPASISITTGLLLHALAITVVIVLFAAAKVYEYGLAYKNSKGSFP